MRPNSSGTIRLIGLFSRGLLWRGTARKVRNDQTCDADRSLMCLSEPMPVAVASG